MRTECPTCKKIYDDAARWTICPHNSLSVRVDAPYCRKHDLYDCACLAPENERPAHTPVLFLDIDGVLNNVASLAEGVHLLPEKVLLVRDICKATGAKVVITSAWRALYDPNVLRSILHRAGLSLGRDDWGGFVCEDRGRRRNHEIADYVAAHGVERYVILDDDDWDWYPDQSPHFVQTPVETGITRKHVKAAIEILRGLTPTPEPVASFTAGQVVAEIQSGDEITLA